MLSTGIGVNLGDPIKTPLEKVAAKRPWLFAQIEASEEFLSFCKNAKSFQDFVERGDIEEIKERIRWTEDITKSIELVEKEEGHTGYCKLRMKDIFGNRYEEKNARHTTYANSQLVYTWKNIRFSLTNVRDSLEKMERDPENPNTAQKPKESWTAALKIASLFGRGERKEKSLNLDTVRSTIRFANEILMGDGAGYEGMGWLDKKEESNKVGLGRPNLIDTDDAEPGNGDDGVFNTAPLSPRKAPGEQAAENPGEADGVPLAAEAGAQEPAVVVCVNVPENNKPAEVNVARPEPVVSRIFYMVGELKLMLTNNKEWQPDDKAILQLGENREVHTMKDWQEIFRQKGQPDVGQPVLPDASGPIIKETEGTRFLSEAGKASLKKIEETIGQIEASQARRRLTQELADNYEWLDNFI